ncbi:hypothetical protein MKP05_09720 [Halomonas sp. EGI 63088]|uniref:Uncharacterized protein n=1 Tax=Halomonas flagellata TaxID=2920385 RepID=A0ABS9RU81_9GAMM|nr:hypothetical protein [Halomonas flagellata]MCH4563406.1 hypothetical protein [Halomonas flagellata]
MQQLEQAPGVNVDEAPDEAGELAVLRSRHHEHHQRHVAGPADEGFADIGTAHTLHETEILGLGRGQARAPPDHWPVGQYLALGIRYHQAVEPLEQGVVVPQFAAQCLLVGRRLVTGMGRLVEPAGQPLQRGQAVIDLDRDLLGDQVRLVAQVREVGLAYQLLPRQPAAAQHQQGHHHPGGRQADHQPPLEGESRAEEKPESR